MVVQPGSHLGPYKVLAQVGAGGMGEVWKARDTRLDRIVAIKTSSEQFSERFEREARAVAALNHPHICQLYDVGANYLVMEYIEGQPLRAPLPLEQALKYGAQICDALDAAHRKGVVHRDLKPANILVTKTGVKLLDFGLARIGPAVTADDNTDGGLTAKGEILGTLHYMSPEQLQGQKADSRSDIFSFGLVLYEMLTGKRAFDGSSPASVIAAVLERDAPSIAGAAPASLDRVLRRCLAKNADHRWQSASDLKAELEWIAEAGTSTIAAVTSSRRMWRGRMAWVIAATFFLTSLLALFIIASNWRAWINTDVTRFTIYPPDNTAFASPMNVTVAAPQFALSPDGRSMVLAATAGGKTTLWIRSMEEVAARELAGTEGAQDPFWSADSKWVGFFSAGKLRKIPASSGVAQLVTEGTWDPRGASWGPDDTILFTTGNGPIYRVSSAGGTATAVTTLEGREASHRHPQFLPDGRHFIFTVRGGSAVGIYVGSLNEKTKKRLVSIESSAVYSSAGYLLYVNEDTLVGQAFDAARLEFSGQPFTIAEHVTAETTGHAAISVSVTGVLAYASVMSRMGRLNWLDREGNLIGSVGTEGDYTDFRLSTDGKWLAASLVDPKGGSPDIWKIDLARNNPSRFTFGPRLNAAAVWSPDGAWIAFRTNRTGLIEFYRNSAAGGGNDEPLLQADALQAAGISTANLFPSDWSPDGKYLLFSVPSEHFDLWLLSLSGHRTPEKFLISQFDKIHGNFSPDGHLVAYSSNENLGKYEVYVRPFPLADRSLKVSSNGGYEPRWRGDGREIYYLSEDRKLMAVSVSPGPSFGIPTPLFQTRVPTGLHPIRTNYVPSPDGRRFLVNTQTGDAKSTPITVVLNWTAGLKK